MALDEKTIPEDFTPDPRIADEIQARLTGGKLACATAFAIAHKLDVDPLTVGKNADGLEIRLTRCQLGLFGYPGKQGWAQSKVAELPVPPGLHEAIEAGRDDKGYVSCAKLWEIAAEFRVPRMQVGYLTDQMGIRIMPCQLGAF